MPRQSTVTTSAQSSRVLPDIAFNPSKVWPETPSRRISQHRAFHPLSYVTLLSAFVLAGGRVRVDETISLEELEHIIELYAAHFRVPKQRIIAWAESLLIPYTDPGSLDVIEPKMPELNITLHDYQRQEAAWFAARSGGVAALSCGTGKSVTAWAAAIGAARNGRCSTNRCYIIAPLNAIPQWEPYTKNLKRVFRHVEIISVDSAHKYARLPDEGGALIVDECHKIKNIETRRSSSVFQIRLHFDWCVCLTGTLLHSGPAGVLAIQETAVPGLSRFADKWQLGEAFNCIIKKQIGPRTIMSLVIPSGVFFDAFAEYLKLGVRSLSFACPSIKEVIRLPDQVRYCIDTWPTPDWVIEHQERQRRAGERITVHWLPQLEADTGFQKAVAALAHALAYELHYERGGGADGEINEDQHGSGFPSFAKLRAYAAIEGLYDRCLIETDHPVFKYRWLYAPGTDAKNPGFGPKIRELLKWISEHPLEPLLIGCVSTESKRVISRALTSRGISYAVIDGKTGVPERKRIVEAFQNGALSYIIAQQVAGSESITLTRASTSILVDHHWGAAQYSQFLARTHRISQTRLCEHYDYAFGHLQKLIVENVQKGERFDSQIRERIETLISDSLTEITS